MPPISRSTPAAVSASRTSSRPCLLVADWAAVCSARPGRANRRSCTGSSLRGGLDQLQQVLVGDVELAIEHRVAGRVLVDVGGAVPDPLPGDEDRQLHVQLELAHLERARVPVAHQVVDQAAVVADLLGAAAVGHPRRLHDRGVVAHVVDDADEAVVEDRERLVEHAPRAPAPWPGASAPWLARRLSISACLSASSAIAILLARGTMPVPAARVRAVAPPAGRRIYEGPARRLW